LEAYNSLKVLRNFLIKNQANYNFKVYDFDLNNLPKMKFDLVISLYSLDYHYDFEIYKSYLKKVCSDQTRLVFDTVRPDYFRKLFKKVEVISETKKRIHSSKRIICSEFAT